MRVVESIRSELFIKLQSLPLAFFKRNKNEDQADDSGESKAPDRPRTKKASRGARAAYPNKFRIDNLDLLQRT